MALTLETGTPHSRAVYSRTVNWPWLLDQIGQAAVLVPLGGAAVGFNVALVHGHGGDFLLHDYVGLVEALVRVAQLEFKVVGDVGAPGAVVVVQDPAGADAGSGQPGQPLVDQGSVLLHGFLGVHHRSKDLEVYLNQLEGLFRHMGIGGGHGGDGVALVEGFAVGQDVVAEKLVVDHRALGKLRGPAGGLFDVGGSYHGPHTGEGFSLAGINGPDDGMGVGTTQNLAVEHPGQVNVRAVVGLAGNLVGAVGPHRPGADDLVFLFIIRKDNVWLVVEHLFLHLPEFGV